MRTFALEVSRCCRVALILLLTGLGAQSAPDEPFGLSTVTVPAQDPWRTLWTRLEAEIEADRMIVARCRPEPASCNSVAAQRFIALVDRGAPYQGLDRIRHVNRAVNLTLRPRAQGTWTSPLAALALGEGDCKQHAVLKYAVMLDAGFEADDVRLIVGSLPPSGGHAVVAVRSTGRWFILDNRSLDVTPSEAFVDFTPHHVLDHRGVRRFVTPRVSDAPDGPCGAGAG
jgi:predicted transglutaminase-like cysteine proteinase